MVSLPSFITSSRRLFAGLLFRIFNRLHAVRKIDPRLEFPHRLQLYFSEPSTSFSLPYPLLSLGGCSSICPFFTAPTPSKGEQYSPSDFCIGSFGCRFWPTQQVTRLVASEVLLPWSGVHLVGATGNSRITGTLLARPDRRFNVYVRPLLSVENITQVL